MENQNLPAKRSDTRIEPPSLPPWAANYEPWQTPPEEAEQLRLKILDLKPWLEPAAPELMAMMLDKLFNFARTFNIQFNPEEATKIYQEALASMPGDLLEKAIHGVVTDWKWGNRLPMPADIQALVRDEYKARLSHMTTLRSALNKVGAMEEYIGPLLGELLLNGKVKPLTAGEELWLRRQREI